MLSNKLIYFLVIPAALVFIWSCALPEEPKSISKNISISDVDYALARDEDNDGFISELSMQIATHLNGTPEPVFARLHYYQITKDTLQSTGLVRSEVKQSAGSSDVDTINISLFPDSLDLNPGFYNFDIQLYSENAPDFAVAQIGNEQNSLLKNVKLELSENEGLVSISSVEIVDAMDRDNDGKISRLQLGINIEFSNRSGQFLIEVHGRHKPSGKDNTFLMSAPFQVDRQRYISVTLQDIIPGTYDLSIVPYFANSRIPEPQFSWQMDSALAAIEFENESDDPAPKDTLSFLDGSFESTFDYIHSPENPARFAVRFSLPGNFVQFRIITLRIHVDSGENYVLIDAWKEIGGFPGENIYNSTAWRYLQPGWNNLKVETEFLPAQPFYVGFHQVVNGALSLSVDKSPPFSSRNLVYSSSINDWQTLTNSDLAIEAVVEYVTTSGKTGISRIVTDGGR